MTDVDLERRLETIERQLVALANSCKELFARVDRVTEQVELGGGRDTWEQIKADMVENNRRASELLDVLEHR